MGETQPNSNRALNLPQGDVPASLAAVYLTEQRRQPLFLRNHPNTWQLILKYMPNFADYLREVSHEYGHGDPLAGEEVANAIIGALELLTAARTIENMDEKLGAPAVGAPEDWLRLPPPALPPIVGGDPGAGDAGLPPAA